MPSGFRLDTDAWLKEYEEAKVLAKDILQLIQDRNVNNASGGPEASRKTAAARRKIGTLGTQIERLMKALDDNQTSQLSEQERTRRRDLLYDLRNRREQMQGAMRRNPGQAERDMLFAGGQEGGPSVTPQETERTAPLDTAGILTLQKQMMREQDEVLEHMEKTVQSTKHIALAIGEEATLQTRLLDDLDEHVDVTQTRMKAAHLKVKQFMRDKSTCRGGFCIFLLIVVMVVVLIVTSKLAKLFG